LSGGRKEPVPVIATPIIGL